MRERTYFKPFDGGKGIMSEEILLHKIKQNIFHLDMAMSDAPYHGFTGDHIKGVLFAINKVLEDTGITPEALIKEFIYNKEK